MCAPFASFYLAWIVFDPIFLEKVVEMELAHPRGNFPSGSDAFHLLKLSTNRFFRVNDKQGEFLFCDFSSIARESKRRARHQSVFSWPSPRALARSFLLRRVNVLLCLIRYWEPGIQGGHPRSKALAKRSRK